MESKAYDLSLLGQKLKEQGLDVAEEALEAVVEAVFNWVEDSAKISTTNVDDLLLLVLPKIKEIVLKYVDKIDGKAE